MEINTKFINENELVNMTTVYRDIQSNFRNSITINPQMKNEIEEVYNRALLNFGRSILSYYNLKYLEMFEELSAYYDLTQDEEFKKLFDTFNTFPKYTEYKRVVFGKNKTLKRDPNA